MTGACKSSPSPGSTSESLNELIFHSYWYKLLFSFTLFYIMVTRVQKFKSLPRVGYKIYTMHTCHLRCADMQNYERRISYSRKSVQITVPKWKHFLVCSSVLLQSIKVIDILSQKEIQWNNKTSRHYKHQIRGNIFLTSSKELSSEEDPLLWFLKRLPFYRFFRFVSFPFLSPFLTAFLQIYRKSLL